MNLYLYCCYINYYIYIYIAVILIVSDSLLQLFIQTFLIPRNKNRVQLKGSIKLVYLKMLRQTTRPNSIITIPCVYSP